MCSPRNGLEEASPAIGRMGQAQAARRLGPHCERSGAYPVAKGKGRRLGPDGRLLDLAQFPIRYVEPSISDRLLDGVPGGT